MGAYVEEPPFPRVEQPIGGWPEIMVRLEPVPETLPPDRVAYWLASYSRQWRVGAVCVARGADMVAFPHMTVLQVLQAWFTMRAMAAGKDVRALVPRQPETGA